MSSAKFAAITANLLARKGEAAPSVVAPVTASPRLVSRGDRPFSSKPRQADNAEKLRRIMVSVTPDELERLGIAAIKKGTNRHDIVRGALNDYFRKLAAEFPCACMEGPAVTNVESTAKATHPYPVCAGSLDSAILDDKDCRESGRDVMAL